MSQLYAWGGHSSYMIFAKLMIVPDIVMRKKSSKDTINDSNELLNQ